MENVALPESLYIDDLTLVDPRISLDADDACPPPPFIESAEPINAVEYRTPYPTPPNQYLPDRRSFPSSCATSSARSYRTPPSLSPPANVRYPSIDIRRNAVTLSKFVRLAVGDRSAHDLDLPLTHSISPFHSRLGLLIGWW